MLVDKGSDWSRQALRNHKDTYKTLIYKIVKL